jgi:hypothetical protein
MEIWNSIPPGTGERLEPLIMGYQGCCIKGGKGTRGGFTYGDMVTYKGIGETGDRLDKGSIFERVLLSTTPEGLLPGSLKPQPF